MVVETPLLAEHVGENVKTLRKALGLIQADLAAEMEALGFGWVRQTVAETEAGRRDITIAELVSLAQIFDVPLARLVGEPGTQLPRDVAVGHRIMTSMDLLRLVQREADDFKISDIIERREKVLASQTKPLGPIFLYEGEGHLGIGDHLPPWTQRFEVHLESGVPYVARDEYEAEHLLEASENPKSKLRVIDRHEAYRIRRKLRGAHTEG